MTTLDEAIASIETHLAALGAALRDRDAAGVESQAQELQRALAGAIHRFAHAARQPGGVPIEQRRRLAAASGQVAAQRESLARATAALDRAIDILLPGEQPPGTYQPHRDGRRPGPTAPCVSA